MRGRRESTKRFKIQTVMEKTVSSFLLEGRKAMAAGIDPFTISSTRSSVDINLDEKTPIVTTPTHPAKVMIFSFLTIENLLPASKDDLRLQGTTTPSIAIQTIFTRRSIYRGFLTKRSQFFRFFSFFQQNKLHC